MAKKQWCRFIQSSDSASGKTHTWIVQGSGGEDDRIGRIYWHGPWRAYIFQSEVAIYNVDCLRQIAAFVALANMNHQVDRNERKLAKLRASVGAVSAIGRAFTATPMPKQGPRGHASSA